MADRLQYSNKALVGNWYEDRLDASRAPIPELERTGKFRVTPLKMTETTAADYVTTSQHYHSAAAPLVPPPQPQMIGHATAALSLHPRQPTADARPYGFGSVVPRHLPDHDRRRLDTTTHSTYGGKYADAEEMRRDPNATTLGGQHTPAGKVWNNGLKSTGIRTGGSTDERLQLGASDPKVHTFVQRTWLGHDSHQEYVLRADEFAATRAAMALQQGSNVPGLALKGLGEQDNIPRVNTDHSMKFYKRNDTIRRDTGIWNE